MASKGYVISVANDSRLFEQGVRMGIIKPVQDADDALTDLGKNKGPDQLADEIKQAQRATDKLGDEARQAAKQMQSDFRKTGDEARELARAQKQAADQSTHDFDFSSREKRKISRETVQEIGNEAKQNAAETFSSFDGSAQSFVDGIQGTLGGLVSSLGPLGLAIGAAGALGIGLVNGALQNGQANSEQFKADVADLTQALIDAGNTGEVSIDRMVEKLKTLATTGDDAGVTLAKLDDLTSRSGNNFEDVARAYAGNTEALKDMVKAGKERLEQLQREGAATDTTAENHSKNAAKILEETNAQKDLNGYLEQASQKAQEAAKNAELYAESGAAQLESKAALIKNIDDAYDDAAGSVDNYIDAETGVFNVDGYIAAMKEKAQALDNYKSNLQKAALTLTPEATAFIESQGQEGAAKLVQAYVSGTSEQQATLAAIWNTAGQTSATSYSQSLRAGLPATMQGPRIVIDDVDTSRIISQIRQTLDGHTFKVNAFANVRVGNAVQ